jgi:hypothetical protein
MDPVAHDSPPAFCSVALAARTLGISRSAAYQRANEWLDTDGRHGLPCVRLGRRILVPNAIIEQWRAVGAGHVG